MYSPTREGIESLLSENHALKEEIAVLRKEVEQCKSVAWTFSGSYDDAVDVANSRLSEIERMREEVKSLQDRIAYMSWEERRPM